MLFLNFLDNSLLGSYVIFIKKDVDNFEIYIAQTFYFEDRRSSTPFNMMPVEFACQWNLKYSTMSPSMFITEENKFPIEYI